MPNPTTAEITKVIQPAGCALRVLLATTGNIRCGSRWRAGALGGVRRCDAPDVGGGTISTGRCSLGIGGGRTPAQPSYRPVRRDETPFDGCTPRRAVLTALVALAPASAATDSVAGDSDAGLQREVDGPGGVALTKAQIPARAADREADRQRVIRNASEGGEDGDCRRWTSGTTLEPCHTGRGQTSKTSCRS